LAGRGQRFRENGKTESWLDEFMERVFALVVLLVLGSTPVLADSASAPTAVISKSQTACWAYHLSGASSPGDIVEWSWKFGVNPPLSATGKEVDVDFRNKYSLSAGAGVRVDLTVKDASGQTATIDGQLDVGQPGCYEPLSNLVAIGYTRYTCTEFVFEGSPENYDGITHTYQWTIQSVSGTQTVRQPSVKFPGPGTYHVALTVHDSRGETASAEIDVTSPPVGNTCAERPPPPTLECTKSDMTIDCNASTTYPIKEGNQGFCWYWGDGGRKCGSCNPMTCSQNPDIQYLGGPHESHTYKQGGTFTVKVDVVDEHGYGATAELAHTFQGPAANSASSTAPTASTASSSTPSQQGETSPFPTQAATSQILSTTSHTVSFTSGYSCDPIVTETAQGTVMQCRANAGSETPASSHPAGDQAWMLVALALVAMGLGLRRR
jgi:PKD repeat protein